MPDTTGSTSALRVDARPAFNQPVVVDTTKEELRRIVARLKGDGREKQIDASNRAFRRCVGKTFGEEEGVVDEDYCGDVLVFYCARFLLDGRGIPFVE